MGDFIYFFLMLEGSRSLCFTDQPKELQFKILEMCCGSHLPFSKGLFQLSSGQGSWTTFSKRLNWKLGWIFFSRHSRVVNC